MKKMFKIGYTDKGGRLAGDRAHRQLVRNESPTAPGADGVHTAPRGGSSFQAKYDYDSTVSARWKVWHGHNCVCFRSQTLTTLAVYQAHELSHKGRIGCAVVVGGEVSEEHRSRHCVWVGVLP